MLRITQAKYAESINITQTTASHRVAGIPFIIGSYGTRYYPLDSVAMTLRPSERHRVGDLVAAAEDDGSGLWLGSAAAERGKHLYAALSPRQRDRADVAGALLCAAIGESMQSAGLTPFIPVLRYAVLVAPGVLRYVLNHDRRSLPTTDEWVALAMVNASFEFDPTQEQEKLNV